jgi:hypothetical protein
VTNGQRDSGSDRKRVTWTNSEKNERYKQESRDKDNRDRAKERSGDNKRVLPDFRVLFIHSRPSHPPELNTKISDTRTSILVLAFTLSARAISDVLRPLPTAES